MKFAIPFASLITAVSAKLSFVGVAESSGEFGLWSPTQTKGTGLPGRFGVDYAFISKTGVDEYVDKNKVNLFRIAFALERMCPLEYGLGSKFNETHFDFFKEAVDYITVTKKAYCILDPHSYMRYNDPSQAPMTGSVIGNASDPDAATTEDFAAFWGELAGRFKDNERVMFGLMNEPHDMPTALVFANNQAAVTAIRAVGAGNLILVPGGQWSGGHSWTENWGGDLLPNADFMHRIDDPADNFVIDVHEYMDQDYSGTRTECTQPYPGNMDKLTAWLRGNGLKAMVTEFGGSNTTACEGMLDEALRYMADNDEYVGWTAWAAGPFWGPNSPCCTDQRQLGSLEPGSKAADGGPSLYDSLWPKVYQPHVPAHLQREGPVKFGRTPVKCRK